MRWEKDEIGCSYVSHVRTQLHVIKAGGALPPQHGVSLRRVGGAEGTLASPDPVGSSRESRQDVWRSGEQASGKQESEEHS